MLPIDFARLVRDMREAQREYRGDQFNPGRQPDAIIARAKALERQVDREVRLQLGGPTLFDREGEDAT